MKTILIAFLVSFILVGCESGSGIDNKKDQGNIINENPSQKTPTESTKKLFSINRGETKTFKSEKYEVEITYNDTWKSDEVLPPEPQERIYSYYKDTPGEKYLVTSFKVKNLSGEGISEYLFENFLGEHCTINVVAGDKYTYSGYFAEVEKDSEGKHDLTSYIYINPLTTTTLYFISSLPDEAANLPIKSNICIGEDTLKFNH